MAQVLYEIFKCMDKKLNISLDQFFQNTEIALMGVSNQFKMV